MTARLNAREVIRPSARRPRLQKHFVRGRTAPRGVAWFGFRTFWGHLRHFVASAIATEDIDSRAWMNADDPEELAARVIHELGGDPNARTVVAALGRDLWIDYVADTGDDVSVSAAVARLLFADYELEDPGEPGEYLAAPRGDILLFGGDTAYPVATAQEITNRVLVPFNRAIAEHGSSRPRVLLGIPGNHDWYDGLDGFARLFRRREPDEIARPSLVGVSHRMLDYYSQWAREFVRGGKVEKPRSLALSGYVPVQNASYFALPISESILLIAADRQLKALDHRQCRFFAEQYRRHADAGAWVLLPDPLYHFGAPSPTGTESVEALGLDFASRPHFLLAGDLHHYERLAEDNVLHVVAGGGGAFLHPAPLFEGRLRADVRWPDAAESRLLLREVPWKIALGRSGLLPHLVLAAIFAPAMLFSIPLPERLENALETPLWIGAVVFVAYTLIGGVRRNVRAVAALAFLAALVTSAVPLLFSLALTEALARLSLHSPDWLIAGAALLGAVVAGAWVFGAYLALLTRFGLEQTQAFTALDHPGYKHFLRLRVHADGRTVDGWCLGLTDPLHPEEQVCVVDKFRWVAKEPETPGVDPRQTLTH